MSFSRAGGAVVMVSRAARFGEKP